MTRLIGGAAIAAVLLATTGCTDISGGGWIFSKAGPQAKANFGLTLTCTDDGMGGAVITGTVEYQDKGWIVLGADGKNRSLSLHGTVDATPSDVTCEQLDNLEQFLFHTGNVYAGTYVTQPASVGAGGNFLIQAVDNGPAGPDKTDALGIIVLTGAYGGYTNSGVLQGGNITGALP